MKLETKVSILFGIAIAAATVLFITTVYCGGVCK
jgi:hypothetical protein